VVDTVVVDTVVVDTVVGEGERGEVGGEQGSYWVWFMSVKE